MVALLQHPLLDEHAYAFDDGIVVVLVGTVGRLEVYAEEFSESLPESGTECAQEGFQYGVGRLVGLPVYELHEHLSL